MLHQDDLTARITHRLPELSAKQRRIARVMLDDRLFVAYASASQVAERAGVSASSVVRFCRALEFRGYTHLQEVIRDQLPSYRQAIRDFQQGLMVSEAREDLVANAFSSDIVNIERTAASLSREQLDPAVAALAKADRVAIVGGGLSAAPALYLAHSLRVMGFEVEAITSGGVPLALGLAELRPGAVLVGISTWRYLRDTIEALRWGREHGIAGIAISDSEISPLAQLADHYFVVSTEGVAHSHTVVAIIALLDVVIAALAQALPERTVEALRRVDAAYRHNGLLSDD